MSVSEESDDSTEDVLAATTDACNRLLDLFETTGFEEESPEQLAILLRDIGGCKRMMAEIERSISFTLGAMLDKKYATIAGVALERESKTGSTTWDFEALLPVLLARSSDERRIDRETGEALESEAQAFLRLLRECVGLSYARVGKEEERTGLRGRGINPDDYRTLPTGPPRAKVIS